MRMYLAVLLRLVIVTPNARTRHAHGVSTLAAARVNVLWAGACFEEAREDLLFGEGLWGH